MTTTNPNTPVSDDNWFHGNIDKDTAAELLKEEGEEGTFLVRISAKTGDYALSVLYQGEVLHFQIMRHGNDAFFSIANETEPNIIHGLDELIKYYQFPENSSIYLKNYLPKHSPPPEVRRHGRTNLLHRATKEGETQIVREMVRCGHRNVDAKNEDGQTAAHLSAIKGRNDILKILIEAGANVNAKDSHSHSPLHYACIHDHPEVVRTLLQMGNANPQLRRTQDGCVPLHIAAEKGHNGCIKELLDEHAPIRPRTNDEKLPIQLADENGHTHTVEFLKNYKRKPPIANRDDWYHSGLNREVAAYLLEQCQLSHNNDSSQCYFLVRRSRRSVPNSNTNLFVLTYQYHERISNFEIKQKDGLFFIDDGPYLDSLEDVIDHYSRWSDGLHSVLQIPVRPTESFSSHQSPKTISSVNNKSNPPPPLPSRRPKPSPNGLRLNPPTPDAGQLGRNQNNINNNINGFSKDNIPSDWIELGALLGTGEYGDVYEGKFTTLDGTCTRVAIKTLKDELDQTARDELFREGQIMMNLENEHIVKFIGISWRPKIYMIQELMSLGSLHAYIKENCDDINPLVEIPLWACQIAKGMMFLEEKEVVHRDVALRNILLGADKKAKISDFGLSRVLGAGKNYYTAATGGRWPVKWYALESCFHGTFSHKSDVWSYGVTLWEMYSNADDPYGKTPGNQVIEMLEDGYRLEKPEDCPDDVYEMIKTCWLEEPEARPSFSQLHDFFTKRSRLETPL